MRPRPPARDLTMNDRARLLGKLRSVHTDDQGVKCVISMRSSNDAYRQDMALPAGDPGPADRCFHPPSRRLRFLGDRKELPHPRACAGLLQRAHRPGWQDRSTHGGLECGIFQKRIPGIDMVTMSCNCSGAHSPGMNAWSWIPLAAPTSCCAACWPACANKPYSSRGQMISSVPSGAPSVRLQVDAWLFFHLFPPPIYKKLFFQPPPCGMIEVIFLALFAGLWGGGDGHTKTLLKKLLKFLTLRVTLVGPVHPGPGGHPDLCPGAVRYQLCRILRLFPGAQLGDRPVAHQPQHQPGL